jgi:hypothetical protein
MIQKIPHRFQKTELLMENFRDKSDYIELRVTTFFPIGRGLLRRSARKRARRFVSLGFS